jgi:hypothetical protein
MMGDRLFPFVENAVERHRRQTGDDKVFCMRFEAKLVGGGHPTEEDNDKAANTLIQFLETHPVIGLLIN